MRVFFPLFLVFGCGPAASERAVPPPNILWLSSEDNGPELGCYGDAYATTPSLDRLALDSLRYNFVWSNAPVCASARTTLITGSYATTFGAHHHRSRLDPPPGLRFFPSFLRDAGYYCTNHAKEDYNIAKPGQVWDESGGKAHWRNRAPNQPFFAVFNIGSSHESQIRKRPHELVHDPAEAPLPAYHPDLPEVRHDWAQYYDQLTVMDRKVGQLLEQLEADGLTDSTIVFYFGDHGSGMPRSKRWAGDSGLRVPLLVHIPKAYAHLRTDDYAAGGATDRLVSFVDFAPTVLSLAGVAPPATMQGRAFLGPYAVSPRQHVFGFRGRMDERVDLVRSVSDGRYLYLRSFLPGRPHGQHVSYQFETPTTRVWKQAFERGELNPEQSHFWEPRSIEELYDLSQDPDEVHNLIGTAGHKDIAESLRAVLHDHLLATGDLGFLAEDDMLRRLDDRRSIPTDLLVRSAERATDPDLPEEEYLAMLEHADSAVRWWGIHGLVWRGTNTCRRHLDDLLLLMEDREPSVQVAAAYQVARLGGESQRAKALDLLCRLADPTSHDFFTSLSAWDALDRLDNLAAEVRERIAALPYEVEGLDRAFRNYLPRLRDKLLADL